MHINEAIKLQVDDIVIHKFLKTEWVVIETHLYKSNPARFAHVLRLKDGKFSRVKFNERMLHLWKTQS